MENIILKEQVTTPVLIQIRTTIELVSDHPGFALEEKKAISAQLAYCAAIIASYEKQIVTKGLSEEESGELNEVIHGTSEIISNIHYFISSIEPYWDGLQKEHQAQANG